MKNSAEAAAGMATAHLDERDPGLLEGLAAVAREERQSLLAGAAVGAIVVLAIFAVWGL